MSVRSWTHLVGQADGLNGPIQRLVAAHSLLRTWLAEATMPTKAEIEVQRAEDRRREAWLDEQIADCRARFDLTLTPEEQADISDDLANDRDGQTRGAVAWAQREAARQLGRIRWPDIEGRAIVAQIDAWKIIEDAADRCAPADAGEDAGRKLRFYLHALAVRAALDGRDPQDAVADAVFYLLAGDRAAREVWRRLDDRDGEVALWVGVLLSQSPQTDADADRDAAQTLRRLRKVAWTCLCEWVRKDASHPVDGKIRGHGLDCERWREAVAQTRNGTLAGALASAFDGGHRNPQVGAAEDSSARPSAGETKRWTLRISLAGARGAHDEDATVSRSREPAPEPRDRCSGF